MPKALHDALAKEAKKKGMTGERAKRYVYGGLFNEAKRNKGKNAEKRSMKEEKSEPSGED